MGGVPPLQGGGEKKAKRKGKSTMYIIAYTQSDLFCESFFSLEINFVKWKYAGFITVRISAY